MYCNQLLSTSRAHAEYIWLGLAVSSLLYRGFKSAVLGAYGQPCTTLLYWHPLRIGHRGHQRSVVWKDHTLRATNSFALPYTLS